MTHDTNPAIESAGAEAVDDARPAEPPKRRRDRELIELLTELRVGITAVGPVVPTAFSPQRGVEPAVAAQPRSALRGGMVEAEVQR